MASLPRIVPASTRVVALVILLLLSCTALGQVTTRVRSVTPTEATAGRPVTLTVTFSQTDGVERVLIIYRAFGESEYRQAEMDLRGTTATVTLPASSVLAPSLEYYIVLGLANGQMETYPISETPNPLTTPPQRTLRMSVAQEAESGILFLSPETDAPLAPEDVLISFSLLRVDSLVDRSATRVLLDGTDVTASVVLSGEIGVLAPEAAGLTIRPGQHTVIVRLLNRGGQPVTSASVTFIVTGLQMAGASWEGGPRYFGSVNLESRHETVSDEGVWYNRGSVSLGARYQDWKFTGNVFVTSDEKSDLQPQNRYFAGVESPWIKAGYGDNTPNFPDLILSGKRVRGVHAALTLGFFNVQFAQGQTTRPIEGGLLATFPDSSLAAQQAADPTGVYLPRTSGQWGKYALGTYGRDLVAVRPSFGSGETWQVGVTYMTSKDDMGSILTGRQPQQNTVAGFDFVTRMDDRRIEISGQTAFSLYNSDISSGDISDERIGQLFPNDSSSIRHWRDIISTFITANENLRPLSARRLTTLAGEASVLLRYFDNSLKFTYLYRGGDYLSFGQSYLRKDIQGFNLNDRIRLVENTLLLTLGYERLQDNTAKTKSATTTYATFNVAATYAPRADAPSVTVGYSRYDNSNGLAASGPDSLTMIDDVTDRIFVQSAYDFLWGARHTASVSVSSSNRSDASLRKLDVNAATIGFSLQSRFDFPLTSSVDLAMNYNKIPSGVRGVSQRLDYATAGLQVRYEFLPGILAAQTSVLPTFGDFRRTVFGLLAEWNFVPSMRFAVEFNYFKNDGVPDENLVSATYRYDL